MNGPLAQLITLTSFGNVYLKSEVVPANFDSENSTFQYCIKVDFREVKKRFLFSTPGEVVVAEKPTTWFQYLKSNGCKRLSLYFENSKDQSLAKDYKLAGMVGGGGIWLIEAIYDSHSNYWGERWAVTNSEAEDNRIWSVNYVLAGKKLPITNLQFDHQQLKEKLSITLTDIAALAFKNNLQQWGDIFDKARANLESQKPSEVYYHKDMVPTNNYTLTAQQLLFAAGAAWVFGGMGSWNDLGFDTKEDNEAIIASVNSF